LSPKELGGSKKDIASDSIITLINWHGSEEGHFL
jgi:hypothetical protein